MRREIITGLLFCLAINAQARSLDNDEARLQVCREVVRDIESATRPSVLEDCFDFYWHVGDAEDSVHPYDRIVQIGERLTTLAPEQSTLYGDTAWIYWSRWKETAKDPESYPQQQDYRTRAIRIVEKGVNVRANLQNFMFTYDTAFTIYLMQKEIPELIPQMVSLWKRALVLADMKDPVEKQRSVNIAKQLGYYYYNKPVEDKISALKYFRYALKLQPSNAGAKKMVEQIERELNGGLR